MALRLAEDLIDLGQSIDERNAFQSNARGLYLRRIMKAAQADDGYDVAPMRAEPQCAPRLAERPLEYIGQFMQGQCL